MLWHKTGFFKSITKVCKILQFHKSSNFLLQNKSNCGRIFFVEFLYTLFFTGVADLADVHGSGRTAIIGFVSSVRQMFR